MSDPRVSVDDIRRAIWLTRPDIRRGFRVESPDDPVFTSWCFGPAKTEYKAVDEFPEAIARAGLNQEMEGFEGARPVPLTRAMYGLWRLRPDLREEYDLDNPDDLERYIWWFSRSAAVDPTLASSLHPDHWRLLCAPSPEVEQDFGFKISVLMHHLYNFRADLRDAFDLGERDGRQEFIMWYLVHGVGDPLSFARVTQAEFELLTAPVEAVPTDTAPAITNFMYLLWLWRADLRADFDLGAPAGRAGFVAWFFAQAVNQLPLRWLINEATRAALLEPITWDFAGMESFRSSRCVAWIWNHDADLKAAFPLSEPTTPGRLSEWLKSDDGRRRFPLTSWLLWPEFDAEPARDVVAGHAPPAPAIQRARRRRATDGVTLVGFARGILGIGEDLRMMSRALSEHGIKHSLFDVQPSANTFNFDDSVAHLIREEVEYETCVFVLTAMETTRVMAVEGLAPFADGRAIGYWPWEFDRWPEAWRFAGGFVDEIWASTRFSARAYETGTDRSVSRMPMAVALPEFQRATRAGFGLPERDFLFIFAFDINSGMARKNPMAVLEAFLKAFPSDTGVGLVIKVSNFSIAEPKFNRLRAIAHEDSRIHIISDTLSKADWLALMDVCDCFVSLHRSEGFGRILAEAMLLEKPVIATNYSGNVDFLSDRTGFPVSFRRRAVEPGEYPFADGLVWANPSLADAAARMRQVVEDPAARASRSAAGRDFIATHHAPVTVGQAYRERFADLFG